MKYKSIVLALMIAAGLTACSNESKPNTGGANTEQKAAETTAAAPVTMEDRQLLEQARKLFKPLPTLDERKRLLILDDAHIALGHRLYFDKRLSKNQNQSCNSCHDVAKGGVDNLTTSPGSIETKTGNRNSPTVLNAGLLDSQFWDGRAATLAEQAKGPLVNPVEMALVDHAAVEDIVRADPDYVKAFEAAFTDKQVNIENIATAIAAYEEMLLTPSPWDDYLNGNTAALNAQEKAGLQKFIKFECTACHTGVTLGGNTFQKFGLIHPYWEHTGSRSQDKGRFEVTGNESDMFVFRTPGLRNVADTAPYFHDGSVDSLEKAVAIMGKIQLDAELSDADVADITAFLKATSGKVDEKYRHAPN